MKLTVKKEVEQEVDVPIPCFYKTTSETEFFGIFSEKDYREVFRLDDFWLLKSFHTDIVTNLQQKVSQATPITEEEFVVVICFQIFM